MFQLIHGRFFPLTLAITMMLSLFGMNLSLLRISIKHSPHRFCSRNLQNLESSTATPELDWQPDYTSYKKDFPNLADSQWKQLEALSLKLYDWNTKVNLVSRKDVEFLIPNHIIPCLSMSLIRNFNKGETIIDVGTGGGLPGLPLAIACPNAQFTLVDSNSKKMMVVSDIAAILGLKNVRVICSRAEKVNETFDFMLGRAVSALPNFLSFSSHFVDGKSVAPYTSVDYQSVKGQKGGITISSGLLYLKGGSAHLFSYDILRILLSSVTGLIYGLYADDRGLTLFRPIAVILLI